MTIDARTIIGTAAGSVSFEGLENRQLMSAVGFANNTITINGTSQSDDIRVMLSADGKTISASLNNGSARSFKANDVYAVKVNAGEGNNKVTFDTRITASADVKTCEGNDTITAGAGNDRIRTAGGNDVVAAGAGNDYIETANGDDRLDFGSGDDKGVAGDGRDTLIAGEGKDAAYGEAGEDSLAGGSSDVLDGGLGEDEIVKSGSSTSGSSTGKIRRLSLVNADTGAVISGYGTLTDGMTLDLTKLPAHLTVVAEVDGRVESAKFSLSDSSAGRIDNGGSSYSMTTPDGSHYDAWNTSKAGSVKLSVTPYTADGASGTAGQTMSLTLKIKRASTNPTPPPRPMPQPSPINVPTTSGVGSPNIKLKVMRTTVTAGEAFHAEATQTIIPGHQAEDATFSWDFGDVGSRFNTMPGFNAAHVYEGPGSYTAKLTVTAPNGKVSTQTMKVNVVASNVKTIYVAASGSDSNDGSSQGKAVKTLAKATSMIDSNAQILLKRGDTFQMKGRVDLNGDNVTLSSYGSGSNPTLLYTGSRSASPVMVSVGKSATNVTIRGLTFNSIYSTDGDAAGMPHAINAGGTAVTVRDNTFLNVGFAINANARPTGLLAMDNKAPLANGLRAYFVWGEGTDLVIVGNSVANSTREHIVRLGGADRVNIAHNSFANLDRTKQGDRYDYAKGVAVVQRGSFAYVAYNQLRGPVGVGPLGGTDGIGEKGARFKHAAFEGNTFLGETMDVHHGAEHVTLRGNTSYVTDVEAYKIEPYSGNYGRGAVDVVIDGNVAINHGEAGNFLLLQGDADRITLTNNVYVAPNLKPGAQGAAALMIHDSNLNSFERINNNVWPSTSRGTSYARGGAMVLGTTYASADHRTNTEWNAMSKVGDDQFRDVSIDKAEAYAMKITTAAAPSKLRLAA